MELAPFSTFSGWRASAPAVDLAGPELERVGARFDGDTVSLRLRLRSARGADNLATEFRASGPILAASVEGRELPPTADVRDSRMKLPYVGLPADGITVMLKLRGGGTLRATMSEDPQLNKAQVARCWAKVYVVGKRFKYHRSFKRAARRAKRLQGGAWDICGGMHIRE